MLALLLGSEIVIKPITASYSGEVKIKGGIILMQRYIWLGYNID